MVDPVDEVQRAAILDRGADDHLLHPGGVVGRDLRRSLENARAVDHQIDAQFRQRQRLDGLLMRQADGLAVQDKRSIACRDRRAPPAMDAVEFHQQRMLFGIPNGVVQEDDLACGTSVDQIAQDKFSDAAKAVQGNTCHGDQVFACGSEPIASTRDCRDIRLSDSNGNSTKAVIRRRSAA